MVSLHMPFSPAITSRDLMWLIWARSKARGLRQPAAEREHRRAGAERRTALIDALADSGLDSFGRSGLGVWVPVAEEAVAVQQLLERGWAVSAGERFRFSSPPGIRITTTGLAPDDARLLAAAIRDVARPVRATYAG